MKHVTTVRRGRAHHTPPSDPVRIATFVLGRIPGGKVSLFTRLPSNIFAYCIQPTVGFRDRKHL
jgi:hypothetical protein